MKQLLLILSLSLSVYTTAQVKVLFLGNSFTYVYDVPGMFEELANEAGVSVFVDSYADPGIALGTWTGASGHNLIQGSLNKINSQDWDFVVVQDNLGIWIGNDPYQQGYDDVVENLANIKNNNSCTEVIYFAGWCPEGGAQTGDSESACGTRVYDNFVNINTNGELFEIVSPVAKAWNTSFSQQPGVDLYYSDDTHASVNGAYLAASTLFVSILKKDPTNLTWYPTNWYDGSSMSSSVASNMRTIAWNTVTDNTLYTESNLSDHTPEITISGSTLTSSGYSSYQWYLDGIAISGATSPSITGTTNGTYTVVGFDGACDNRSFEIEFTGAVTGGGGTGIDELMSKQMKVYPNPVNDVLNVSTANELESIVIVGIAGNIVYKNEGVLSSSIIVSVSGLANGVYILFATDVNGFSAKRKFNVAHR